MIQAWVIFFVSALLIVWAGTQLTYRVDNLAEVKGLSRGWLGFILLASITSLPELITTVYSAAGLGVNDQAIGNVFGSNLFNVLIFVIIAALFSLNKVHSHKELSQNSGNLIAGLFYIFITTFFIWWIIYEKHIGYPVQLLDIDFISLFILVFYFLSAYFVWKGSAEEDNVRSGGKVGVGFYILLIVIAGVIVGSGIFLSWSVKKIAIYYNLSYSFAGAVLLAIVTSLPELVVSISSINVSSPEMAHGNILGSNLFNLINLAVADIFFTGGSIYWHMDVGGLFLAAGSIIIVSLMLLSIVSPPKRSLWGRVSWLTFLILIFYFVSIYASWLK